MNGFDLGIIHFLNQVALRSETFDTLIAFLVDAELLKGGVLMALLWWVWFRSGAGDAGRRETLLVTLVAGFAALCVARGLALVLPFRLRPVLALAPPHSALPQYLHEWSAFPSDHATLFFALATGLLLASRAAGMFAAGYVFVAICVPRVYIGLHYPTDIIAGAALGVGITWLAHRPRIREAISRPGMQWLHRDPGSFYTAFFLVTYQIATLFNDVRRFGSLVMRMLDQ